MVDRLSLCVMNGVKFRLMLWNIYDMKYLIENSVSIFICIDDIVFFCFMKMKMCDVVLFVVYK